MIWILYIILDALVNWYIIVKKKESPDHFVMTIIRGIAAIIYGGFIIDVTPSLFWYWFFFCTTSFWVLFDPLLNVLRGLNPFYIGQTAKLDQLGNKYKPWYWLAKVLAAGTSFLMYTHL